MPSTIDLTITNGRVVTPNSILKGGIAIHDGKIIAIKKDHHLPKASETINAQGNLILPGLIDVHTHLRDLELQRKEDFYTGTCAALVGGFTSVLDMPNTRPLTNSASRVQEKMMVVKHKSVANVGLYASLPDEEHEGHNLCAVGVFGIKIFLHRPLTSQNIDDDAVLLDIFAQSVCHDLLLALHAEDKTIIDTLETKHRSLPCSTKMTHSRIHSYHAEVEAVKRILFLAKHSNPRLHFCHVSTHQAVALIQKAKRSGLNVSCEVTPHHIVLSSRLINTLGTLAQVEPPLRSTHTVKRLQRDLVTGQIDIVASDHAPHTLYEKQHEDPWQIPSGFPGLETTLPVMLTLMNNGQITLHQLVDLLAYQPSQRFRIKGKGVLHPGFDADITIINPSVEHVVDPNRFHSKARYSPFTGMKVIGKPTHVILKGKTVMKDGTVLAQPGSGSLLAAASSSFPGRQR
jgi:dihydroorotase